MQFRLKDGSVVELPKDCSCVTHKGPHWLYADDLYREANQKLLQSGCTSAFAIEEQARLRSKLNRMNAKGITEILR